MLQKRSLRVERLRLSIQRPAGCTMGTRGAQKTTPCSSKLRSLPRGAEYHLQVRRHGRRASAPLAATPRCREFTPCRKLDKPTAGLTIFCPCPPLTTLHIPVC